MDAFGLALCGHLMGDYLIQNDWMASNKKTHWLPCLVHVITYTLTIALWCSVPWWSKTPWPWWALLFTAVTHYAFDCSYLVKWYCRLTGRLKFIDPAPENRLFPWSWISVDNSFHIVLLGITQLLVEHVPW